MTVVRRQPLPRRPRPKIPVTPVQTSELIFDLAGSARRRDAAVWCAEVVAKIKALARDNERMRNIRCFAMAPIGTGRVLAAAFESLAAAAAGADAAPAGRVLEDILATTPRIMLTWWLRYWRSSCCSTKLMEVMQSCRKMMTTWM